MAVFSSWHRRVALSKTTTITIQPIVNLCPGDVGQAYNLLDAIYPHVHYTVINGPKLLVSEGLPSYFRQYKLFTGKEVHFIGTGRVDSGDIIESEK